MRTNILAGPVLAVAAVVMMLLGEALDLEVEAVTLLGIALGAVVALVPDATPGRRIAAFGAGFAVALVGYVVRAAVLPDSATGRAVAVAIVILLAAGVTALSMGKLPLWGVLLGAGALAGAYEYTYSAAPTLVLDTAVSTSTAMLLSVAVGFVVATLVLPKPGAHRSDTPVDDATTHDEDHRDGHGALDNMMEKAK